MKLLVVAVLLAVAAPAAEAALRCGNRLVDEGDREFQVRERCGDPFWIEQWVRIEVLDRGQPFERQREVESSTWTFNFGPRALMQQLTFVDGVLQRIESLGYGVAEIGTNCPFDRDLAGMSSGELVARCGEPAERRRSRDTVVLRPGPRLESWRDPRREEWVYDFGEDRLLRVLDLEHGRVVRTQALPR